MMAEEASSDKTKETSEGAQSVVEEDEILFGSTNASISEELYNGIKNALTSAVASLPLLQSSKEGEGRDKLILNRLMKIYSRNVDLVELYGSRNIFTIQTFRPRFRERVLAAFEAKRDCQTIDDTVDQENLPPNATGSEESKKKKSESFPLQIDGNIPSSEEMELLEREIVTLREKLKTKENQRNSRLKLSKDMQEAEELSRNATNVCEVEVLESVKKTIEAVLERRQSLKKLIAEAESLIETMGRTGIESDQGDGIIQTRQKRRRQLTLEEHFAEEQSICKTNIGELRQLKSLLKRQ